MKKLRSKKELVYDSRSNKAAVIEIKIANWNYDLFTGYYLVTIIDYFIDEDGNSNEISTITREYVSAQISGLFQALQTPINLEDDYSEQMNSLIINAQLLVTQQDPIYGSEAEDWEIITTEVSK